jgi:hypothetical protein
MTHGNENLESLMSQAGRGESIALTAHSQRLKPADRDLNLATLEPSSRGGRTAEALAALLSADGDRRRSGRATSPPGRDNELSGISRGHRR